MFFSFADAAPLIQSLQARSRRSVASPRAERTEKASLWMLLLPGRGNLHRFLLRGWVQSIQNQENKENHRFNGLRLMVWAVFWWLEYVGISCSIGFRFPFYWHWQSTFQTQGQSYPLLNPKYQNWIQKWTDPISNLSKRKHLLMVWCTVNVRPRRCSLSSFRDAAVVRHCWVQGGFIAWMNMIEQGWKKESDYIRFNTQEEP